MCVLAVAWLLLLIKDSLFMKYYCFSWDKYIKIQIPHDLHCRGLFGCDRRLSAAYLHGRNCVIDTTPSSPRGHRFHIKFVPASSWEVTMDIRRILFIHQFVRLFIRYFFCSFIRLFNRFSIRSFVLSVLFSRDEATLYERVSVRWLVGPSVRPSVGHAFVFRPTRSDECRVYGPFTCFHILC